MPKYTIAITKTETHKFDVEAPGSAQAIEWAKSFVEDPGRLGALRLRPWPNYPKTTYTEDWEHSVQVF